MVGKKSHLDETVTRMDVSMREHRYERFIVECARVLIKMIDGGKSSHRLDKICFEETNWRRRPACAGG